MIDEVDEAIRRLLIREIPIKDNEVDIDFHQPRREWSGRLSRPTINIYLHDVRENIRLRGSEQWDIKRLPDGTVIQKRAPVRINLDYLITSWTKEPEDEHSLLTRVMMSLFRYPTLPKDLLGEALQGQPTGIPLIVAQEDLTQNTGDIWKALDNEVKPAIMLRVTITLDPYLPIISKMVRTTEIRIGQAVSPAVEEKLIDAAGQTVFWTIGGKLITKKPLNELHLTLLEQGREVEIKEEGNFAIGRLRTGEYTLEISQDGKSLRKHKIKVPSPDYELEV